MIDGVSVGTTPYQGELGEGSHTIRVERDGYEPMERSVEGTAGVQLDEAFNLEKKSSLGNAITPKTEMIIGYAAIGVGVAALAAGIALIVIDEQEIQSDCSGSNVDSNGVCRYRHNTLVGGAVSTALGVVGIGGGIGLVVHGRKRAKTEKSASRGRPKAQVGLRLGGVAGRF
jgi:hypothetical protein